MVTPSDTNVRANRVDLFEREQLGVRHELEVLAEDLARHAIGATEVAAVGHRDAQVAQGTPEGVGDKVARHLPVEEIVCGTDR